MRTLTRVRIVFVENRTNVWLRFGRGAKERILSPHCRDIYFTPRSIFACVTWRGNVERTLDWRVEILRSLQEQEPASQLENVEPGAEILLRASGVLHRDWPLILIGLALAAVGLPLLAGERLLVKLGSVVLNTVLNLLFSLFGYRLA